LKPQSFRLALIKIKALLRKGNKKKTMTTPRLTLVFLLIFAVFPNHLFAADAHKGEMIAKRWCVACHIVSSDQPQGTTQAPPFSAVASKPYFNETTLAYFLLMPHPRMPDMNLSRSEAADFAAYIRMQR
jgi:mono/diheme cytochrome c family protein